MFQHHFPFAATGEDPGIDSRDTGKEFLPGFFWLFMLPGTSNAEEFLAQGQLCLAVSVAQDAIMHDLHETIRKDMQEEATDKLGGIQGLNLGTSMISTVKEKRRFPVPPVLYPSPLTGIDPSLLTKIDPPELCS